MPDKPLARLLAAGQSPWIDNLSREALRDGTLERRLSDDSIVGVTSNPTIFQKAMASGDTYDDQMRELMERDLDDNEIFLELAATDVRDGCDLLRPVWDEGNGRDGYVSLEVDPNVAHDTEATLEQTRRISQLVDRPNLFVKIPATPEGLPAIEQAISEGIAINVTLIFSLERYAAVAEAYIKGLERLAEAGGDLGSVASVASFFVSRVDSEVDKRLDEAGGHDQLKGKIAIANAKLAYERYKQIFAGERWERLASAGATTQRCLWASTSTKNPDYRDVLYVEELIGPETVDTMPDETIDDFQDHGVVEPTLERDLDGAHGALDALEEAGISYEDVTETLEREGVQKFADSIKELKEGIAEKRRSLVAA